MILKHLRPVFLESSMVRTFSYSFVLWERANCKGLPCSCAVQDKAQLHLSSMTQIRPIFLLSHHSISPPDHLCYRLASIEPQSPFLFFEILLISVQFSLYYNTLNRSIPLIVQCIFVFHTNPHTEVLRSSKKLPHSFIYSLLTKYWSSTKCVPGTALSTGELTRQTGSAFMRLTIWG